MREKKERNTVEVETILTQVMMKSGVPMRVEYYGHMILISR